MNVLFGKALANTTRRFETQGVFPRGSQSYLHVSESQYWMVVVVVPFYKSSYIFQKNHSCNCLVSCLGFVIIINCKKPVQATAVLKLTQAVPRITFLNSHCYFYFAFKTMRVMQSVF